MSGSQGGVGVTVAAGQTSVAQITGVVAGGCQLPLNVKFATSRSFIAPDQRPALEQAFAFGLAPASGSPAPAPNRFLLLIGHTDQVGGVAANQALSRRRANAVLAVFSVDPAVWETNFQAEHWNGPNFEIATMSAEVDPAGNSSLAQQYLQDPAARLDLFRRYLLWLRPSWLPQSSPPVSPAMVTTPNPPVLGCGFAHPRVNTPGQANADNRRVEFFYFQSATATVASCAGYPARQVTCGRFFTLQVELHDECDRPFTGAFDLTLPTGGMLTGQQTDDQGRYSRDNVPPGRFTVRVGSWSADATVSAANPLLRARLQRRITASGTQLMLGGRSFRFFGTNAYYLLEAEATSRPELADFFRVAAAAGIKVVRTWGFNEDATKFAVTSRRDPNDNTRVIASSGLDPLESVIDQAAQYGIYLIIALANYNPEYGGICEYARRVGYPIPVGSEPDALVEELFYTGTITSNPAIGGQLTANPIDLYRDYVRKVILRFSDKTNILAWELMNEPRVKANNAPGQLTALRGALQTWLAGTAAFVRSLHPPQLLSLGGVDIGTLGTVFQDPQVRANIDLADTHLYPVNFALGVPQARTELQNALTQATATAVNKPFYLGEYGLQRTSGRTRDQEYGQWSTDLLSGGAVGMLFWELVPPSRASYDEFEINVDINPPPPRMGPLQNVSSTASGAQAQPPDGQAIVDFVNLNLNATGPGTWRFC